MNVSLPDLIRPKDLPLAGQINNSDYVVLDQGDAGLKRVPISALAGFFIAGTFQALATSGAEDPEGSVQASPPSMYFQIQPDGTITFNIKVTGIDTTTGWIAFAQGKPVS